MITRRKTSHGDAGARAAHTETKTRGNGRAQTMPILVSLVVIVAIVRSSQIGRNTRLSSWPSSAETAAPARATTTTQAIVQRSEDEKQRIITEFQQISERLIGPDKYGNAKLYNHECGINSDCPRFYTVDDIQRSVDYMDEHADVLVPWSRSQMGQKTDAAVQGCNMITSTDKPMRLRGSDVLDSGGYCLRRHPTSTHVVRINGTHHIPMSHLHSPPSQAIASVLTNLVRSENVSSISDYGAGIGQYKAYMRAEIPPSTTTSFDYLAFDGAGNVEEYTLGFVKHFDLSFSLALPRTDWVVSLEVGEHVPSKFEGVLIRNLHRHNCKGIILSWAILGQGGVAHINNHSNKYVIDLMNELGYDEDIPLTTQLRSRKGNNAWFLKSSMAFRRKHTPVQCTA